jgi:hypothetical protein
MPHPVMTCERRLLRDLRRPPAAAGTPPRLLGAAVLLGLVTIAFYLTGVPLRSTYGARVNGDEPFYLLTTVSLLEDGDLDLANDYALHRERAFFDYPGELWRQSVPTADGRLLSPHNAGTSLLILPGYALGGLDGAKGLLAVLGGATVVWTVLLAHRATGHSGAALVAGALFGASAPLFVYSTQVYPEGPAALLVAVCAWLALGRKGGWRTGLLLALGLNGLLWLGVKYAAVAAVLAGLGAIRLRPGARIGFLTLLAAGATGFGWFHLATYGGLTPYAVNRLYAGSTTVQLLGAHFEVGERLYRLAGLWIDREFGLFRWAPALLLVLPALPLVARRAGPARWTVLLVVSTQLLVATFFSVTMRGWWFPGRMMIAVLPLLAVPVAELLRRLLEEPVGGARPWLLAAVAALGAYGLGLSLALRQAVAAEVVVLAAEPFALPWAPFQVPGALFPLFTSYEPATWGLTAAWLLAGGGAVLLGRWLAADPAPSPYPRPKSEVPSPKSQAPALTPSITEA